MFNTVSRVDVGFFSKNRSGGNKKRRGEETAALNPAVTTGEAQMSVDWNSFQTSEAVLLSFHAEQRAEAGRHEKLHLSVHSLRILQINLLDYEACFELCFSSPLPLSSSFKRNILKKTLFPDYRALYRRTRKYQFWPRRPKSYFLSLWFYSNVASSPQGR